MSRNRITTVRYDDTEHSGIKGLAHVTAGREGIKREITFPEIGNAKGGIAFQVVGFKRVKREWKYPIFKYVCICVSIYTHI